MLSVHSDNGTQGEFKRGAASGTFKADAGLVAKADQEEMAEQIGCGCFVLLRYGKGFVPELYRI